MTEIEDVVHGTFEVPELIAKIIDTDVFKRLKKIHQTGILYFIAQGANHNRHEHCLG